MVAGRGSRVQSRGRGSNVAVAGPMSRSRVQSRGRGSNVAAGENDLGFEVTEWKRVIWKKYKGKKIVFMHDTLREWLKVRDGRGTKKEKTGFRPRFSRLASRAFAAQRSHACPPLTKSEEKERLLAVYIVFIVIIYSFFESTQVIELPCDVFASLTKVTYLWVLHVLLQNYLFNITYLTLRYLYIFKTITFVQQGNFRLSVHPFCLNPSDAILVPWTCCFLWSRFLFL